MVVLVTGGGSGIGRGIALRFASEGAAIAICDINLDAAKETESMLKGLKSTAKSYVLDVTDYKRVHEVVSDVAKDFGKIDVLVNSAGVTIPGPVLNSTEDEWNTMININLKGTMACSQAAGRIMAEQKSGNIISIASESGKTGKPLFAVYAATKFAVVGFTQGLAAELAPMGVRVNAVCPGIVQTNMWKQLDKDLSRIQGTKEGEALEMRKKAIPLGRLETPEDVAGVVAFLASEDASYMTGQAVNVTGGREVH